MQKRGTVLLWSSAVLLWVWAGGGCKFISGGQADPGEVGARCEAPEECTLVEPAPICLKMPGGYCSTTCSGGAFDCDDQSVCDELGDQAYYCLDGCLTANGNADCRSEYRCSLRADVINFDGSEVGVCVPVCARDGDCEAGRRCDTASGNCVAKGERATGDPCATNGSCNGGLCLTALRFRGGYCSGQCGTQYANCEPGSHCVTVEGQAVCLSGCDGDADCRSGEGYFCRQVAETTDSNGQVRGLNACIPRCQSDEDCGDGRHCDAASGDCADGAGDPNPLGAFCAGDGDCQSGVCLRGGGWANGYCTESSCAGDGDCGGGVCRSTTAGDRCLAPCGEDLDCRPGYLCDEGGCQAYCQSDADCAGGRVCSSSTGRCVVPSTGGGRVESVRVSDGIRVDGSLSEELSLDVPADAVGFSILASGSGEDAMIIGEMHDPTGRQVYDFQDPFGSAVRFFPDADQITQLVPSSPRTAVKAGRYTFRLIKDGGAATITVDALIKIVTGEPQEGTLDLNFFFANVPGLSAESAPGDSDFQVAIAEMRGLYAGRGVQIGDISYCNLSSADRDRFSVIDSVDGPGSELSRMFATSVSAADLGCNGGPAMNFFFVQEIVGGQAGYIILGIAGGIPGPGTVHGTSHSGVAVTTVDFRADPRELGQVMAHEGGHYLGLFHTTEAEGTAFDPLPDTPECGNELDANADGLVDVEECLGHGTANLMFWAAGGADKAVSTDQGFILLRNPALR